jgi:uncharacterized protein HemY
MLPYQERVIEERAQLSEKLVKLDAFLDRRNVSAASDTVNSLGEDERRRLVRQSLAMQNYLDILDERIAAWTA